MTKYTPEVKAQCVEKVRAGVSFAEITRELGPNPKAIQRYCEKAGIVLPKRERKAKVEKVAEE